MADHTITITKCVPTPNPLKDVHARQQVKFCSDDQLYWVTGLENILREVPVRLEVPAKGCSGSYTVSGKRKAHPYTITGDEPCLRPNVPPEIIIVD